MNTEIQIAPDSTLAHQSWRRRVGLAAKRVLDLLLAVVLLLVLAPTGLLCALLIRADSVGPVFFRQDRLGLYGRIFRIWKFRTMVVNAQQLEREGGHHKDDPIVTRLGAVLRKFHLDEFPQLLNVVRGEMSLVGPRPLLPQYLDGYSEEDKRRLLMPPGMTGWQQVVGSSDNSWEERVALDVWYVDHWSPWLDLWILVRTAYEVPFRSDKAYARDGRQDCGIPTKYRTPSPPNSSEGDAVGESLCH